MYRTSRLPAIGGSSGSGHGTVVVTVQGLGVYA
jgi:hypothetical protein